MNKIKKVTGKLLSLILAAAMCMSLVPTGTAALAATADTPGTAAEEEAGTNYVSAEAEINGDYATDPLIEEYIAENLDAGYATFSADNFAFANLMTVKQSLFDAALVEPGDTLDSIMGNIENDFDMDEADKFIVMFSDYSIPLYDVDPQSDYLVAYADTMHDDERATLTEACFARTNNNGEVLTDCICDLDTGLVYIPRYLMDGDDDDTIKVNAVQVQFMQLHDMGNATVGDEDYYAVSTEVDSVSETADGDLSSYVTTYPMFDIETTVRVDKGMDAEHLVVTVNGAPYTEDNYSYDPETGYITIPEYPAMVQSVMVAEEDAALGEKLVSFLDAAAGVVEANAAVSVSDMKMPDVDPVVLDPDDGIKSGTFMRGDMCYEYHNDLDNNGWTYDYEGTSSDLYEAIRTGEFDANKITYADNAYFSMTIAWGATNTTTWDPELYLYSGSTKGDKVRTDFGNWKTSLLECDHSSTDAGTDNDPILNGGWANVTCGIRFFEVNASEGYALIGVYSAKTHDQSGFGLYKMPIVADGYLKLEKSSGNTTITEGNACYDLAGAQYTVYTDSGCTTVAKDADGNDAVLTTDSEGKTNTLEMEPGTYYVKETLAATGYMLCGGEYSCSNSTDGVHKVTVTTADTEDSPAIVKCADTPGNDPAGISLYKIDTDTGGEYTQGAASLEGAQFTVKYYDGYYDGDTLPETAKRTWVIETVFNEYSGTYVAGLRDEDCFVSGDSLYYAGNTVTLPLGTYTVQETLAPTGYLLEGASANSGNWVSENAYTAPVHVAQVTTDGVTANSFSIGNEPDNEHTAEEAVTRFDITLLKHDSETQASLGSVEFSLTSLTTGETHYFWTDESGSYTSDAGENPHSYDTDNATDQHSGLWFYGTADESLWDEEMVDDSVGALPYDDYRLDEIKGENNEEREMIHVDITTDEIRYSGYTLDLGTLNNNPAAYIHTDAWVSDTGTQLCYVDGDNGDGWVTLYDDVYYYNLTPGATYGIYGAVAFEDMYLVTDFSGSFRPVPPDGRGPPPTRASARTKK